MVREIEYINPMGAQLLSALAKSGGRSHKTFLHALASGDVLDAVRRDKPDIVAYCSAKTGEHRFLLSAAARVRSQEPRIFQIMGGPHATYFPREIERSAVDALCVGEGEGAWLDFLDAREAGRSIDTIPNIVTKENRGTWAEIRNRNVDLDALPFLDWDLVLNKTRLGAFPMRSFMVSRGCPFRCSYCFEHRDNEMYRGRGPVLRRMSVRRVCEELSFLKKAYPNTQRIKEYSDVFPVFPSVDDEWLEEWSEEYPKRVGLPFHCLVRADLIARDPRKAELLKRSGLDSVTMSIEIGNERVRNDPRLLDRSMTDRDMEIAFGLFRRLGVATFANCIYGMPIPPAMMEQAGRKAIDYDVETFDMCLKLKPTYVETGVFHPLPGVNLTRFAVEHGWFDGDFDSLHANYSHLSPLSCFTEQEKHRQLRLCFLSTVACLFPGYPRLTACLRHFFVEQLSRWPATWLCYWLYFLAKAYLIKGFIYPMKFTLGNFLVNVWFSARLEWGKRMTYSGRGA